MCATVEDEPAERRTATSSRLARIARRLDVPVSVFYTSGCRTGQGAGATSPGEGGAELINLWSRLDTRDRAAVLNLARRLLDT